MGCSFNEAGATIAPETAERRGRPGARSHASMRPGQQSPRKRRSDACGNGRKRRRFNEAGATIAPETTRDRTAPACSPCFNEAGATIAPETLSSGSAWRWGAWASMRPGQQSPRKPADAALGGGDRISFNEAGATIAPGTPGRQGVQDRGRGASMRPGQQSPRKRSW